MRTLEIISDDESVCILDIPNGATEYRYALEDKASKELRFSARVTVRVRATEMYRRPEDMKGRQPRAGPFCSAAYVPQKTTKCALRKFVCYGVNEKADIGWILCAGWLRLECDASDYAEDIVGLITDYI